MKKLENTLNTLTLVAGYAAAIFAPEIWVEGKVAVFLLGYIIAFLSGIALIKRNTNWLEEIKNSD